MKIQTVKQIYVQDWDKIVRNTYGKIYSFQQQDGCKPRGIETISTDSDWAEDYENDTIPEVINGEEIGVSFKAWLERDPNAPLNPTDEELKECGYYWGNTEKDKKEWKEDKSHINMFWERSFYPEPNILIADLCKRGLLEEGEYQIKIDW
jgi:hypothetical protein